MTKHHQLIITIAGLLLLILSHTQVTLKQTAYRLTGLQYGKISSVGEFQDKAVISDGLAVYSKNVLRDRYLILDDTSYRILGNSQTQVSIDVDQNTLQQTFPEINGKVYYISSSDGFSGPQKLALKCPSINFTLADPLLGLLFAYLIIFLIASKKASREQIPTLPVLVLIGIGLLSLVGPLQLFSDNGEPISKSAGIKEWIQYVEVFVVSFLVFQLVFESERNRALGRTAFIVLAGIVALVGCIDYGRVLNGNTIRGLVDISEVDSVFGFRYNPEQKGMVGSESSKNILAIYCAVMIPVLLSMLHAKISKPQKAICVIIAAALLACTLHLFLLLATIVAYVVVLIVIKKEKWIPVALVGFALFIGIICMCIKEHRYILLDSAAISRYQDLYGTLPMPVKGKKKGSSDNGIRDWQVTQQKYLEMQAAANAVYHSPVLGHGIGHYQKRISQYYSNQESPMLSVVKQPANFMEKDAHSLYIVQAVETGLLGSIALFWVLLSFFLKALSRQNDAEDPNDRAFIIGIAGALFGILLASFFSSFLVRGVQFIVLALVAYVYAARQTEPQTDASNDVT